MPRGPCCPLALTKERRKRERESKWVHSLPESYSAVPWQTERTNAGRKRGGKKTSGTQWKNRKGNARLAKAGEYGAVVLREETASEEAECGHYICPSAHPHLSSQPLSLSMLPVESLSLMCGDSVRRWRIIPVFRAASARPSSPSSSSSSSSISTPLTSQAWISLYHLSQPRFCHSASFAQREVWKVCMCASVRVCVFTCVNVIVSVHVSVSLYLCVCCVWGSSWLQMGFCGVFWRLHLTARSRETYTHRAVRVHRKGGRARTEWERIRARKRKREMVRVVGSTF